MKSISKSILSRLISLEQPLNGTVLYSTCMELPSEGFADLRRAHFENAENLTSLSCSNCMYSFHSSSFTEIPLSNMMVTSLRLIVSKELPIAETTEARDIHKQIEK